MRSSDPDRFPGWRVVTAAFVVLAVSSGFGFYGLAVYLNAFKKERGWEISAISLATTLFFLVGGVVGLWVARLISKRDVRHVVAAGGVIGAIALGVLGRVTHEWQLYLVYAVWACGWAASGLVPLTTVITRWYHQNRSTALSVASTGLSVGGIVITPAAKWLLDEYGLRAVTPWLGLVWFVGIVPITLWLLYPDPGSLGWHPDGERVVVGTAPRLLNGAPFAAAVRDRFFLAVTVGYVLLMGSQVGGIQQLVRLMEERAGRSSATLATSVLAGTSVVARLVGGQVARRLPIARMTVVLGAVQCASLVLLAEVSNTAALFAATVLFGATVGNILMLQPLLIADRYGVLDYPRIYSRSQFITMFGTAGGPLLLGWLHDAAGGYETSYLVAGACAAVGALVLAAGGPAVPWSDSSQSPASAPMASEVRSS